MENFTGRIQAAGEMHFTQLRSSEPLKTALVSQAVKTALRDRLVAAEGETPFEIHETATDITWLNNVIQIQMHKPTGRIVIAHTNGELYNMEEFRARIEQIRRAILQAAGMLPTEQIVEIAVARGTAAEGPETEEGRRPRLPVGESKLPIGIARNIESFFTGPSIREQRRRGGRKTRKSKRRATRKSRK
jgi:hypothetical protein